MYLKRKTYPRILERALRKCERYFANAVVCYSTPVEYVVLCHHFGHVQNDDVLYYKGLAKEGCCRPTYHYIRINKWDREYPVNPYASLDHHMTVDHT